MTTTMNKTNHNNRRHLFMDTSKYEDCYRAAKIYTENFEKNCSNGYGLYINGTDKQSKLNLAGMVQKELAIQGKSMLRKTVREFLYEVKKACDKDDFNGISPYMQSREVDILVLHDFGDEPYTREEIQILYHLVCDRYESMKPIIITTKCDRENLAEALVRQGDDTIMGEAIVGRLAGTTIYLNIE